MNGLDCVAVAHRIATSDVWTSKRARCSATRNDVCPTKAIVIEPAHCCLELNSAARKYLSRLFSLEKAIFNFDNKSSSERNC